VLLAEFLALLLRLLDLALAALVFTLAAKPCLTRSCCAQLTMEFFPVSGAGLGVLDQFLKVGDSVLQQDVLLDLKTGTAHVRGPFGKQAFCGARDAGVDRWAWCMVNPAIHAGPRGNSKEG
jgi:hypothetical protein